MQEIENIISSNNSCFETFKEIDLTDFELEKEGFVKEIPINGLKQVIQSADPDESPFIKEVFLTDKKLDHTGTQISKFSLKKDSLSFIKEGFSNVTLTFIVTFKYDVRDSPNYSKATRINFTVDPKNFEIEGCLGSNSIGGGTISLVDSTEDKSMDGLTGTEACELKNKKCSHVLSQNFASMVYGQDSLANLCQINYNSKANDIKTGTMLSNLHSCEAKVGTFETYTLKQKTSGVTCKGIFRAICN